MSAENVSHHQWNKLEPQCAGRWRRSQIVEVTESAQFDPTLSWVESDVEGNATRDGDVTVVTHRHSVRLADTSDSQTYLTKTFYPDNQKHTIRSHITTPLATYIHQGGYPYEISKATAETGSVVTLVGPEEGNLSSILGALTLGYLSPITIKRTAHNNLSILNAMDDIDGATEPRISHETGASRGAITALAVTADAHIFNREVIFTDAIAHCFAKKMTPAHALKIIGQLKGEIATVTELSTQHRPDFLLKSSHYDLRFLANVVNICSALTEGMEKVVPTIDQAAYMHLTTFNSDEASQGKLYAELFKDFSNTIIDQRPGNHMHIIDKRNVALHLGRSARLSEILSLGRRSLDPETLKYIAGHVETEQTQKRNQVANLFRGITKSLVRPYSHRGQLAA